MEQEIKEIKQKIEDFCKKYNVAMEVDTIIESRAFDGKIVGQKVRIKIQD